MSSKMMIRITTVVVLLAVAVAFAYGAEDSEKITFKGGYTKAVMKEGRQVITLSQGAVVVVGNTVFEADTIELSGDNYRYVSGTGNIRITDTANGLSISATELSYDRQEKTLTVEGWVEIQDFTNEVIATGAYLSYAETTGILLLQIEAKLSRHTDSGPMICRADSILYDRNSLMLALTGNSSVYWKGNLYESNSTSVDLEREEIVLEGTIRGTVDG